MMFSGVLHSQMEENHPVETLFSRLNNTMHTTLDRRTFVCFCLGELDLTTHALHLANGGCPYPYHFHAATGTVTELVVDAYPLGVRTNSDYQTVEIQLEPGDRIVLCSDGIIEAANAQEEIFGFEQTAEIIRQSATADLSATALIEKLLAEVQTFSGDVPQGDDMTAVVLSVEKT